MQKLFYATCVLLAIAGYVPFAKAQCTAPASVTVTSKSTTAAVSWAPVKNSFAYEYYVAASPSTPPLAGTVTTGTTPAIISYLTPSTTYDACVRTICGSARSAWTCTSFQTAAASNCTEPAIVAYSKSHWNGFAEWGAIDGAVSYEYTVGNGMSVPATTGTVTTKNQVSLSSLSSSGIYNICVRTKCNDTLYSIWSCDTLHTAEELDVAATAQQQLQIRCFPNPVSNLLHIETAGNTPGATVILTNIYGVVVYRAQAAGKLTISIQDYAPGIYILRYYNGMNNYSLKVQKQ